MKSLKELLFSARQELEKAGIEDSAVNSDLLAASLLKCERARLPLMWNDFPSGEFSVNFSQLVRRRCNHEPLQYILGVWPFLDFTVKTVRGALIPRPETEEVFLAAARQIESMKLPADFTFADVCTGTGILGIALARRFRLAIGWLSDISPEALTIAKENVFCLHGLSERVGIIKADLLESFSENSLDVIISNPPYINSSDMNNLMPEVKDFEPSLALHGGKDGLDLIRRLLLQASFCLKPGGLLIFEHGHGQRESIDLLLEKNAEFDRLMAGDDLCGCERFFVLQLRK